MEDDDPIEIKRCEAIPCENAGWKPLIFTTGEAMLICGSHDTNDKEVLRELRRIARMRTDAWILTTQQEFDKNKIY